MMIYTARSAISGGVKTFLTVRKAAKKSKQEMFKILGMPNPATYKRVEEVTGNPDHIYVVRLADFAKKELGWSYEKFFKIWKRDVLAELSR